MTSENSSNAGSDPQFRRGCLWLLGLFLEVMAALGVMYRVYSCATEDEPSRRPRETVGRPLPDSVVPLAQRSLPGLRVSLPQWAIAYEQLNPAAGELRLAVPGSSAGDALQIRWSWGSPPSPAQLEDMLRSVSPPTRVTEKQPVEIAGSTTETQIVHLDDGRMKLVTPWSCSDDPRSYVQLTRFDAPQESEQDFHRRILESVRCEALPLPRGAAEAEMDPAIR
ncbi:hypothetical protein [Paraliomyxa miuraensis]|uniref:hypothetical protein n=1 Tax=Paraliomyxa miuraensis TaxID=376150 RepID=UPI0022587BFA|nr:hypothetical protein [Paraliomyxa miuraensis]MCX4239193.1 hypothetical protein [Paraliomyxa miuraensis]